MTPFCHRGLGLILIIWMLHQGNGQIVSSRKARSIGLTNNARINIGVQFILPLTLTLPYVSGRRRRSLEPPLASDKEESNGAEAYLEPRLRKLDNYFHHLNIDEEVCRIRLLCEIAADPDAFYPIGDLVLTKLTKLSDGETRSSSEGKSQRMRSYERAALVGVSGNGTCASHYGGCVEGPAQLINFPILNAWQMISDYLQIGLYDELDPSS